MQRRPLLGDVAESRDFVTGFSSISGLLDLQTSICGFIQASQFLNRVLSRLGLLFPYWTHNWDQAHVNEA